MVPHLVLGVAIAATLLAVPAPITEQAAKAINVVGTLTDHDGKPVGGETVYFAAVKDGRASLDYIVKDGSTVGLATNPHATTDAQGRFTIQIRADQMPSGKEFTLGNSLRWFTRGGKLLVLELPTKPTAAGKWEVDAGIIR
jgi:hypothetical protein